MKNLYVVSLSWFVTIISARYVGKTGLPTSADLAAACRDAAVSDTDVKTYIAKNMVRDIYTQTDRPVRNAVNAVKVQLTFFLQGIINVNEKEGSLKVAGYLQLDWKNEFLIWNDTWPFSCVTRISKEPGKAWLPDVALTNSADDMFRLMESRGFAVSLDSNGQNSYSPGGEITVHCPFDLSLFPFDRHSCSLFFEAWSNSYEVQHFVFNQKPFISLHFKENEQWELVGKDARLNNVTYDDWRVYHQAEFIIMLKRKTAHYNLNVLVPSFVISLVELVTFTLQEDYVVKLHISFTCLLSYSVFQVMVIDGMPRSSHNTPLLSIYIVLQMALIGLTILLEGVAYVLFSKTFKKKKVPPSTYCWAKYFGRILLVVEEYDEPYYSDVSVHNSSKLFGSSIKRRKEKIAEGNPAVKQKTVIISKSIEQPLLLSSQTAENTTKAVSNQQSDSQDDDDLPRRWIFVAQVVDRFSLSFYLSCSVLAPTIMFGIIPLIIF